MVLKFVDAGVKRLGARGQGEGAEESPFSGDRVSVLQDGGKNSREGGGGGDGCDMTGNPRMLPNWTPPTGVPARKVNVRQRAFPADALLSPLGIFFLSYLYVLCQGIGNPSSGARLVNESV